jgi:hypothetical protein
MLACEAYPIEICSTAEDAEGGLLIVPAEWREG